MKPSKMPSEQALVDAIAEGAGGTMQAMSSARPSALPVASRRSAPNSLAVYLPTLALTLQRGEGDDSAILVGVRSTENNVNHPDVVSVPTMRMPVDLGESIVSQAFAGELSLPSLLAPGVAHTQLGYAVWSLLAAKLSLGDAIEAKTFDIAIEDYAIVQGKSMIGVEGSGSARVEPLTMINCLARITKGADLLSDRNPTFSHMDFAPYEAFVEAATTKSLAALGPEFDGLETCIHGLCVASSIILHDAPFSHAWEEQVSGPSGRLGVEWIGFGRAA